MELWSALNNSTFEGVQGCIKSTILWLRWSFIMLWKVLTFNGNWIDPSYHMYDLYSLFRPWLCICYSVPGGSCILYLRSAYKTHNSHIIAQLIIQLILQKCLLFANELNLAIFSLGQISSRQLLKIKNLPAFVCMKCTLQWNVLVSKTQPFCSVELQVQLRTAVSFASWWVSTKPGEGLRPSAVLSPWHINLINTAIIHKPEECKIWVLEVQYRPN